MYTYNTIFLACRTARRSIFCFGHRTLHHSVQLRDRLQLLILWGGAPVTDLVVKCHVKLHIDITFTADTNISSHSATCQFTNSSSISSSSSINAVSQNDLNWKRSCCVCVRINANRVVEWDRETGDGADDKRQLKRRLFGWQISYTTARCLNSEWDDSYASTVLWVETFRTPRAKGGGPLGGANIWSTIIITRSSAIAEWPRDASCQ